MGIYDVPRCQHVKVNGVQCGSPALRRKRFCYFHNSYRQARTVPMELEDVSTRVPNLPLLEDANSVQLAIMQVIQLLAAGRMNTKVAGLMLFALQTASSNLARLTFEPSKPTDVVIDEDMLDLTCISGPQWLERDFDEQPVESQEAAAAKREQLPLADRPKLRKKPDSLPEEENSTAEILRSMGLKPGIFDSAGNNEA